MRTFEKIVVAGDYETKRTYDLSITVTDDGMPSLSRSVDIKVHVLDVNEPPFMPDWTFCLEENSVGRYVDAF